MYGTDGLPTGSFQPPFNAADTYSRLIGNYTVCYADAFGITPADLGGEGGAPPVLLPEIPTLFEVLVLN